MRHWKRCCAPLFVREKLKHFLREDHFYFVRKETRPIWILFQLMQLLPGGGGVSDPCEHETRQTSKRHQSTGGNPDLKSQLLGMADWEARGGEPLLKCEHWHLARSLTHSSISTRTMGLESRKYMKFRKVLLQRSRVFEEIGTRRKRHPNVINTFLKCRS